MLFAWFPSITKSLTLDLGAFLRWNKGLTEEEAATVITPLVEIRLTFDVAVSESYIV